MSKVNVEQAKEESRYLRGSIAETLTSGSDHFCASDQALIKFHGMYQQDDRDIRLERKNQGLEPLYFFMVRSKLPGGKLTAQQYLVHDTLSDQFANGSIRLTTRQGIQLHGVFMRHLKEHFRALNEAMVSTLAACGDVERNVMCCPAPLRDNPLRDALQHTANRIAEHLCPRTTAYHDIWLTGVKIDANANVHAGTEEECIEPIYGKTYLPRKFKTGIALPEDNCIDVLSNDLGLVALHRDGQLTGFDLYIGGGMGMTNGMAKTYPRLASPICSANPDELLDVITAIVKVQRDYGNRKDRKVARLKYLLDEWGMDKFHATVTEYHGKPLAPVVGVPLTGLDDHLGWHPQGDGKWWLGVHVASGRIKDTPTATYKTAFRELARTLVPSLRVTAQQNLLLCDILPENRAAVDTLLQSHGVVRGDQLPLLHRHALACPAIPTCGLALAESERVLPEIIDQIHAVATEVGVDREWIVVHMTGCPNGCARPFNSDIGVVGRSPGKYTLYLGGNGLGTAMSYQFRDMVPQAQIGAVLRGPLKYFQQHRNAGEGFGDFCRRVGRDLLVAQSEAQP